jgi:chemotaxis protein histidine kinase CheA
MKALYAAIAVVALFAGVAVTAVYYTFVLGEAESRSQAVIAELRSENLRLQNLLSEANNQGSRLQADLRSLQTAVEEARREAQQLRAELEKLDRQASELRSQLSTARGELDSLKSKVEQVQKVLGLLENDRVLISWIRTDPPGEREAARDYWNETRALALKSDPNLALTVDKILASLDLYFDWLEKAPSLNATSRQEIVKWCPLYIDWLLNAPPGVDEYSKAVNQFRQEAMLVFIAHIDSLSNILTR